jgi:hypothetical protein
VANPGPASIIPQGHRKPTTYVENSARMWQTDHQHRKPREDVETLQAGRQNASRTWQTANPPPLRPLGGNDVLAMSPPTQPPSLRHSLTSTTTSTTTSNLHKGHMLHGGVTNATSPKHAEGNRGPGRCGKPSEEGGDAGDGTREFATRGSIVKMYLFHEYLLPVAPIKPVLTSM